MSNQDRLVSSDKKIILESYLLKSKRKVEHQKYDIVIIGGGILGVSIGYFLALNSKANTIIIEQEKNVGYHTSSRNTGKVHSPFLYDPEKKKIFAKVA